MRLAFAAGAGAGLLLVLAGAWAFAATRTPVPAAAEGPASATEPPAEEPPAAELSAAHARLAQLEKEAAAVKASAAKSVPPATRLAQALARFHGTVPDGSEDERGWRTMLLTLQVYFADLAEAKRLGLDEASLDPEALPAFLETVLGPVVDAKALAALRERHAAAWAEYMNGRDAMFGVERNRALNRMSDALWSAGLELAGEDNEDLFYRAKGAWLSMLLPPDLRPYPALPEDQLTAKIVQDWGGALGLTPEQLDKVPALVADYLRAVRAARGGTASDGKSHEVEDRAMIDIQRRMGAALGLDAAQLERLRKWASVPKVEAAR